MIAVVCAYCRCYIRSHASAAEDHELTESHGVCNSCLPRLLNDMGVTLTDYLDSLQVPILVFEEDARLVSANAAARNILDLQPEGNEGERAGRIIGCIHADELGGCGQTVHCQSCTIRQLVTETMRTGKPFTKVSAFAEIGVLSGDERVHCLISTEKHGDVVALHLEICRSISSQFD